MRKDDLKEKKELENAKKEIKESLLNQLQMRGADVPALTDRVNAYLDLWEIEKKLTKDIKTRGVSYTEEGTGGKMVKKNNPSVKDAVAVSRQMLTMLKELGLTTENIGQADNSDPWKDEVASND